MPMPVISHWQLLHLQHLIVHAYTHVPLYRDLYISVGIHPPLSLKLELADLPIVKRELFSKNNTTYFSAPRATWNGPYTWAYTSGTTGEPRAILRSSHAFSEMHDAFFAFKLWRCLDRQQTYPSVTSHNARVLQLHEEEAFAHPGHPHVPFSKIMQSPKASLLRIRDIQPDVIQGYTSQLLSIAHLVQRYGLEGQIAVPFVILGGESLTEHQRHFIQEALQCEVYHRYGLEECYWAVAAECREHQGMHPYHENYIIEVVDRNGDPTQPHQQGEVVITDLFNYATPLIRYETGDTGYRIPGPCSCGLSGERIVISGRTKMLTNNGKRLHYDDINRLTPQLAGRVLQWQIIKRAENRFEVRIVRDHAFDGTVRALFENVIHRSLGNVSITFSYPEIIIPEQNGKIPLLQDRAARISRQ